jgi:hypothetical protein
VIQPVTQFRNRIIGVSPRSSPDDYVRAVLARLRSIALGGVSVTLPILACEPPTCDDPAHDTQKFVVAIDASGRLTPTDAPERSFSSCRDLCEETPAVLAIESCEVVEAQSPTHVTCVGMWATCTNHYAFGSGRRPEGYTTTRFGSRLSEMARLEGASAVAFERLAIELAAHDAPPDLVLAARAAIAEELAHERLVIELARVHGVQCERYSEEPGAPRPILEVALENAREGVVSEAFGAVLNGLQAHAATDTGVRALFARLANDEVNHAALSLRVHRWAISRLDGKSAALVAREVRAAHDVVAARCGPDPRYGDLLGHPSRGVQLAVLATLDAEVLQLCG